MLMCLKCYNLFNEKNIKFEYDKFNFCHIISCSGQVVEIDELFVPVITKLNKKGYKTKYCCSGHLHEELVNSYIMFDERNSYLYQDHFNSLPNGFTLEVNTKTSRKNEMVKTLVIRKYFDKKKSYKELLKDITDGAISLLEWAEGLPSLKQTKIDAK